LLPSEQAVHGLGPGPRDILSGMQDWDRLAGEGFEALKPLWCPGEPRVWLARSPASGALVVASLYQPFEGAEEVAIRAELERIERLVGAPHPNLAPIVAVRGSPLGPCWLREYVPGPSLAQAIEAVPGGRLPAALALATVRAVAAATAHVRAVSGSPVLPVDPDDVAVPSWHRPRVLDPGLIGADGRDVRMNYLERPRVKGFASLWLQSPERMRGLPAIAQSGVYSLAALAFRLLSGQRPHAGDDMEQAMAVLSGRPPRRLAELGLAAAPQLDELFARALARDASRRPADEPSFLTELGAILPAGPPPSPPLPAVAIAEAQRLASAGDLPALGALLYDARWLLDGAVRDPLVAAVRAPLLAVLKSMELAGRTRSSVSTPLPVQLAALHLRSLLPEAAAP
jgi:serine/threonine-protein kinase